MSADLVDALVFVALSFTAMCLTVAVFLFSLVARGIMDAYHRAKLDPVEQEALVQIETAIGRRVLATPIVGPWIRRRYS